jgi:hypothetical protein
MLPVIKIRKPYPPHYQEYIHRLVADIAIVRTELRRIGLKQLVEDVPISIVRRISGVRDVGQYDTATKSISFGIKVSDGKDSDFIVHGIKGLGHCFKSSTKDYVRHEYGHALADAVGWMEPRLSGGMPKIFGVAPFVTDYAGQDEDEDLAEVFMLILKVGQVRFNVEFKPKIHKVLQAIEKYRGMKTGRHTKKRA